MANSDDSKLTNETTATDEGESETEKAKPTVKGRRLKLQTAVRGGLSSYYGGGTWSCLRTANCDTSACSDTGGGGNVWTDGCALM